MLFGNKPQTEVDKEQNTEVDKEQNTEVDKEQNTEANKEQKSYSVNVDVEKLIEENEKLRNSVTELTEALRNTSLYPQNNDECNPLDCIATICGIKKGE